jgi:hypothetical protein
MDATRPMDVDARTEVLPEASDGPILAPEEDAAPDASDAADASDVADASDAAPDVVDASADRDVPACEPGGTTAGWLFTTLGDTQNWGVAAASDGSTYVAGSFSGKVDFDPEGQSAMREATGLTDAFLAKLDCAGRLAWVRTWGGPGSYNGWDDEAEALALAPDGGILVTGQYCTTVDFDTGSGVDRRTSVGCFDGFISRFEPDGRRTWTRTVGGTGRDRISDVAVVPNGTIVVVGQFEETVDFDPEGGERVRTSHGETDVFAMSLTAEGDVAWVSTWGGPGTEYGPIRVAASADGAAFVVGQFEESVDFDPGAGTDLRTSAGASDGFVVKLRSDGTLEWARTIGGAMDDVVTDVAVDSDGSVAMAGFFYGDADLDPGPDTDVRKPRGYYDAFLTKLQSDGSAFWVNTWGGAIGADAGLHTTDVTCLAAANGEFWVGGSFMGTAFFDPEKPQETVTSAGINDGFISRFGPGRGFRSAWRVGGPGFDAVNAATVDQGDLVVAGNFSGPVTFQLPSGPIERGSANLQSGFVARFPVK